MDCLITPRGGRQDGNWQDRTSVETAEDWSNIIKIDKAKVSSHLNDLVRQTVPETLKEMFDAEAPKGIWKAGGSSSRI